MPLFRGATPTPPNRLAAAIPYTPRLGLLAAPPGAWGVVPPRLSVWLNDTFGDCVTAEEAFRKSAWSVKQGLEQTFIPDAEVKRWAKAHGVLNGAVIEDVLKWMRRDPIHAEDGKGYTNGPYLSVDYTSATLLNSAIYEGACVKIGVDASPLESAMNSTGGKSGWAITSNRKYRGYDHCVSLCGFGSAEYLFGQLKLPCPANVAALMFGYLLFTWGTIGFVSYDAMVGMTCEAWSVIPGTAEQPAPAPPPDPTPLPIPTGDGVIAIDLKTRTIAAPSGWTLIPTLANEGS